ncbi:MAG: hypothetical protein IJQ20_04130 [Paludibacteraceae bacterium]|nr:hypothetical protein [Paludibacteraceae bacterium]
MEIILNNSFCSSLTGSLSRRHGYYIYENGGRFFSHRKTKGSVPPDGHLRLILDCAQQSGGPIIQDILVPADELREALIEARAFIAAENLKLEVYHARDVLNFKTLFGL